MRVLVPILAVTAAIPVFAAEVQPANGPAKLVETIKSGQRVAALDMIAKKSGDVNAAEADGTTPLIWAANLNDTDLALRLLKAGANAKAHNQLGSTALSEAALNSNTQLIKALLDAGADPNFTGPDGQTALMVVARTANVAAAKLLLDKGANPNVRESQRQQTPLMWAAASHQSAMMRELLAHGAEVDAKSATDLMTPLVSGEPRAQPRPPGGETAMLFAAREGCMDCVKALVEKGAKLDLADPEGVTPLITAVFNTRFDVAKYLIEKGANIDKWDWWGRSPLYLAVDYNTLPHGGRPDQPALDETLPIDIIRLLLDKGANPNLQLKLFPPYRATGNDRGLDGMLTVGTTPLLRAAKAQDAPAIKLLLEHGAIVDLPNNQGMTPLVAASGMGSTDADTRGYYGTSDVEDRAIASLDLILAHGGEINGRAGRFQQTPLDGAAFWGWNKVVQHLLEKGADINEADSRGFTAVDYAMGRAGGNSRGGQRIDVHKETGDLLIAKGGKAGTPIPQPGGGRGGGGRGAGGRGAGPGR
ncbi:MAG TPA: ankyrin repeat domain-containing protein [Bryobacteraceae bacterium]|nr:ankyrin repeat domain-containing protein [Bryobacteraceae bacterium]